MQASASAPPSPLTGSVTGYGNPTGVAAASSGSATAPTSSSVGVPETGSASGGGVSTTTAAVTPRTASSRAKAVGAIAGGVSGLLALLLAALLTVFCRRHRARRGIDSIRSVPRRDGSDIDVPKAVPSPPEQTPVFDPPTSSLPSPLHARPVQSELRSPAGAKKAALRQQELARQVRDMEQTVAGLRTGVHDGGQSAEEVLREKVEALQREVERLKVEQEEQRRIAGGEAPPVYASEDVHQQT